MRPQATIASLLLLGAVGTGAFFNGYERDREAVGPRPEPVTDIRSEQGEITKAKIKADVEKLNRIENYNLTENGLVALARTVYFEGSFDDANKNNGELRASYQAIAEVILNRYLFDICSEKSPVKNENCGTKDQYRFGGEKGIVGIITAESQFFCIADHPHFYKSSSLDDGLNSKTYFGRKKKKEEVATLDKKRLWFAYEAVVSVLDGSATGNTKGAFSYKNNEATTEIQGKEQQWDGDTELFAVSSDCSTLEYTIKNAKTRKAIGKGSKRVQCRVETRYVKNYVGKIGSHEYFALMPERTETVFDNAQGYTYRNGVKK